MLCQAKPIYIRQGNRHGLRNVKFNNYSVMHSFMSIWSLLNPQGEYKRRRRGCERLWAGYDECTRDLIYETISKSKESGSWVNPNPYFAIEDVALNVRYKPRKQILSYAGYYARYHTTEACDGWKMVNPTGERVIYVREV